MPGIWGGAQESTFLRAWHMWAMSNKLENLSCWCLHKFPKQQRLTGHYQYPWENFKKTQRSRRSFKRLMYYAISTTFATPDVIYLRCCFVLGLVPGLAVGSLIFTIIYRILSPFCRRGNRNPEKLRKFSQALHVLRVRARTQAQIIATLKLKCAPLSWAGCGISRHSVKTTLGWPPSFFLHVQDPQHLSGSMPFTSKAFLILFPPAVDVTGRLTPDFK